MTAPDGGDWLPTRDLAIRLGRATSKRALERLRARLHRFGVRYRGPSVRPRWSLEGALVVLGVRVATRSTRNDLPPPAGGGSDKACVAVVADAPEGDT